MMSLRKPRRLGRIKIRKPIFQQVPSDFRHLDLIRHIMFDRRFGPTN
jgi:hypothetical protein